MSYSFSHRSASKSAAKETVSAELDKVVAANPAHAVDRPAAQAAAGAFIDLLREDDTTDIVLTVSGYLSGRLAPDGTLAILSGATVNVAAHLVPKQQAPE